MMSKRLFKNLGADGGGAVKGKGARRGGLKIFASKQQKNDMKTTFYPFNAGALVLWLWPSFAALVHSQTIVPSGFAHAATAVDAAAGGFQVKMVQATAAAGQLATQLSRAEAQLAGRLVDPSTQLGYENLVDMSNFAADGYYHELGAINYEQSGTMPGIPGMEGSTDNIAMEAITYLVLEAGTYTMVVNSDDGFRVTTGKNPLDQLGALELGSYDGGRGASDSSFDFTISQAGAYGFRLIYMEGGGGAQVSWYVGKRDEADPEMPAARALINDVANDATAILAYRQLSVAADIPFAEYAEPRAGAVGVSPRPEFFYRLADGSAGPVDPASVQLWIDDVPVTPVVAREGTRSTVRYRPTNLFTSKSEHKAKLIFGNAGSNQATALVEYSFTVVEYTNLLLPNAPIVEESFDTWAEQVQPPTEFTEEVLGGLVPVPNRWNYHGWTVEQYSNSSSGWDLNNPNSQAFMGWVVLSKERTLEIGGWEGPRRVTSLAENYVNNVRVTSLANGNYFYAESDQRGGSQVQYLISPDYDLTGHQNIHLYFHSLYEQNQDNIAAVEYSIDGGGTWLPALYMMDAADLIMNEAGGVDAEATLSASRGDAANYTDPETGEYRGGYYGAFIGVLPEKWSGLADAISGRVNDDFTESKRVEFLRVAEADGKSRVRFRFTSAGTASWYWGIDQFAIYSMDPADGSAPKLAAAMKDGQLTLTWPSVARASGYTLETSSTLAPLSWTTLSTAGATSNGRETSLVVPIEATRGYYRLRY